MEFTTSRKLAVLIAYLTVEIRAYPMEGWPMAYNQPHNYPDEDYYYSPKQEQHFQNYYDTPAVPASDIYGHAPYPYISDPYGNYLQEAPEGHEERLAALPIGRETWYENETPDWQNDDDVNAAFLNNLILTQMAQDAQKRRKNAYAYFPQNNYGLEETQRDAEDEDVRELKALAGKPLHHVPKIMPTLEEDDYTYSDETNDGDSFINWNGNKRSVNSVKTTTAPTTTKPKAGQKEVLLPGPGQTHKTLRAAQHKNTSNDAFFDKVMKMWANQEKSQTNEEGQAKGRRIEKRYVSGDKDLVFELRGLKHRIRT